MDIDSTPSALMATTSVDRQAPAVLRTQIAVIRELAENQEQIAQILAEAGLGQHIDVSV